MIRNHIRLTSDTLPPAHVERLAKPLVVPMSHEEDGDFSCGVFGADGTFRDMSQTLFTGARLSGEPPMQDPSSAELIQGTWLFAGIGRHHFGHFLVETLIRLWAVHLYKDELDGIVFVPRKGYDFSSMLNGPFGAFLNFLTYDLPFYVAPQPTRFETLLLPSPGFGPLGWIEGTEIFRNTIRSRIFERLQPNGPEKLYISRSDLPKTEKRVHLELQIEEFMEDAGYKIYYPEHHPIEDQICTYMAAHTIVGTDGSAFHLAAFAMQKGVRVALIKRRRRPLVFEAFARQMRAFADANVTVIDAVLAKTHEEHELLDGLLPLDIDGVAVQLREAGFI